MNISANYIPFWDQSSCSKRQNQTIREHATEQQKLISLSRRMNVQNKSKNTNKCTINDQQKYKILRQT
jgi:hypothetical protein